VQPIVPKVYRTGDPDIDRNLDQIYEAFRRLSELVGRTIDTTTEEIEAEIPAPDDHLVKASNADTTTVGGLVEKTVASGGTVLTEVTSAGTKKLQIYSQPAPAVPVVSTTLPKPLGTAAIGSEGKWADGAHVHPQPDPEIESSYLYPAKVPDPLNKGNVRCVFGVDGGGGGGAYGAFIMGWTQDGDTFTRDDVTPLLSATHFDGEEPQVYDDDGYSVLTGALVCLPPSADLLAADKVDWGVYEILDIGRHFEGATPVDTHAVFRRVGTLNASADFVQGMTYYIEAGTNFGGQYATLQSASVVLDTTEQNWTFSASAPTWNDAYELLSSAEITTRGASSATLDLAAAATNGTATMVAGEGLDHFNTVAPLPAALPAGKVDFYLKDVILSGSKGDGVANVITCRIFDDDGATPVEILSATTQHIDWSTLYSQSARDLTCQGTLNADYTWTPGHTLRLEYDFTTDSTTEVSCSFTYNSVDRYTKVGVTWANSVIGGTSYHPDLTGRELADQHPLSSVNHQIAYTDADWDSDTWANVPGLSVDVEAGFSYLVKAFLFIQLGGEGCDINLDGTCTASSCLISHRVADAISAAVWPYPAFVGQDSRLLRSALGSAGAATYNIYGGSGLAVGEIDAIVHVSASGALTVAADCEPTDYHASYILENSWMEVKKIS